SYIHADTHTHTHTHTLTQTNNHTHTHTNNNKPQPQTPNTHKQKHMHTHTERLFAHTDIHTQTWRPRQQVIHKVLGGSRRRDSRMIKSHRGREGSLEKRSGSLWKRKRREDIYTMP